MSLFMSLCEEADGNIDTSLFAQLNSHEDPQTPYFFVPSEARRLFSQQEIEQRQEIADQWFAQMRGQQMASA